MFFKYVSKSFPIFIMLLTLAPRSAFTMGENNDLINNDEQVRDAIKDTGVVISLDWIKANVGPVCSLITNMQYDQLSIEEKVNILINNKYDIEDLKAIRIYLGRANDITTGKVLQIPPFMRSIMNEIDRQYKIKQDKTGNQDIKNRINLIIKNEIKSRSWKSIKKYLVKKFSKENIKICKNENREIISNAIMNAIIAKKLELKDFDTIKEELIKDYPSDMVEECIKKYSASFLKKQQNENPEILKAFIKDRLGKKTFNEIEKEAKDAFFTEENIKKCKDDLKDEIEKADKELSDKNNPQTPTPIVSPKEPEKPREETKEEKEFREKQELENKKKNEYRKKEETERVERLKKENAEKEKIRLEKERLEKELKDKEEKIQIEKERLGKERLEKELKTKKGEVCLEKEHLGKELNKTNKNNPSWLSSAIKNIKNSKIAKLGLIIATPIILFCAYKATKHFSHVFANFNKKANLNRNNKAYKNKKSYGLFSWLFNKNDKSLAKNNNKRSFLARLFNW